MAASTPSPPDSPVRAAAPALLQQPASRRPTVKQDQQILLADKAGRAAQTTLRAIQELGYEATPTGKLVLKRGPNGEPMAVKELTLKRDTTLGQKTLVVVKAGLTLIATLGLSGHNPFFRSELKREWGAQTITAYSQDLTPQEQREADKMIVDDVTVKTKDDEKYNITVQVDTSAYAEKIYNENPAKFTSVESKGMFCIINGDKGRVLHVPYSDGQHPDFSKACVMEYTDSRTGEYITGAEVSGRLVKSAKQYSILYSSLLASSKDSILKAHAHLLTDDALDEAATEHLSKLLSIQGPKGLEGLVQEFRRIEAKITAIDTEFMGASGSPAPSDSKKARLKAEKAELKAERVVLEAHLAAIRKYNDDIQRDKAALLGLGGTFSEDVTEANEYQRRVDAFEEYETTRAESVAAGPGGLSRELTTKLEETKAACIAIAVELGGDLLRAQFEASLRAADVDPMTCQELYEASFALPPPHVSTHEQQALHRAQFEKGLVGRIEYRLDAKIRELKAMAPTADPVQDATNKKVALAAIADMQKGLRIAIREAGGGDLGVARADLKYAEKLDDKVKAAEAREAIRDYKAKVRGLMDATYSSFEIDAHGIPKPLASAAQRSSKSNPLRGFPTVAEVTEHIATLGDEAPEKQNLQDYLTTRTREIGTLADKASAIITQKRAEIQAKIDAAKMARSPHPDLDAELAALQVHLDALGGDRDTLTDQVLLKAVDAATQISAESRKELNEQTAVAFAPPPIPIPGAAAGLITARQRSAQLEGILQQEKSVITAFQTLNTEIEQKDDVAAAKRDFDAFQASLEDAHRDPDRTSEIPDVKAGLARAEQELNAKKRTHYESAEFKDPVTALEAKFEKVTKAKTNMTLEVEALKQYEASVEDITKITAEIGSLTAAIDASASQASLTSLFEERQKLADAQAKAGGALDKLFLAYSVQTDGTVQPAVNAAGQPQLRTRADRKARMEAAIGRVSFDQVYMDPRGAGEGGKIKIGNSGLRWDPNLGAYVEKNKYYQSGSGFEVEVPDQVLEQMLDIYRPAKNPDSKPATKPAAAAA